MNRPNWPKCPKCKSQNVEIIEVWSASMSWIPDDPYYNEGAMMPGDPEHVEGRCLDCDHRWRMRKVIQVQEKWFDEAEIKNDRQ